MIGSIRENTDVSVKSLNLQTLDVSSTSSVGVRGSPDEGHFTETSTETVNFSLRSRFLQLRESSGSSSSSRGMDINLSFHTTATWKSRIQTSGRSSESKGELDPQLSKDIKLILRMLAKDDREYKQLESRFEKMLNGISKSMSSMGESTAPAPHRTDRGLNFTGLVSQSMEINLSISIKVRMKSTASSLLPVRIQAFVQPQAADPIILDIDGDGPEISSVEQGVLFDITGRGVKNLVSAVHPDDGLLALDRNGNGSIDSGLELFGDQHGASHGFEELAKFDSDRNGMIDTQDPVFNKLQVYRDMNRDGRTQKGELQSLKELSISSIDLSFSKSRFVNVNGNRLVYDGHYTLEDGSRRSLTEAMLNFLA